MASNSKDDKMEVKSKRKRRKVNHEDSVKAKVATFDEDEDTLSSEEESTSDDDDNVSSEDSILNDEELNIEFEGFAIESDDFHGIKMLLKQLFIMLPMDISELTDLLTEQNYIGSTLKMTDDEEKTVYGITTLLDLNKNKEKKCARELFKSVKQKCKETAMEKSKQFEDMLEKKTGLLISERFINIPVDVSLPMYASLRTEIEEAKSGGQISNMDYILFITKSVKTVKDLEKSSNNYDDQPSTSQQSKGKKRKKGKPTKEESLQFVNPEDEIFFEESSLAFSYSVTKATGFAVSGSWDVGDNAMNTLRTVMLIEYKKLNEIINKIETMLHQ